MDKLPACCCSPLLSVVGALSALTTNHQLSTANRASWRLTRTARSCQPTTTSSTQQVRHAVHVVHSAGALPDLHPCDLKNDFEPLPLTDLPPTIPRIPTVHAGLVFGCSSESLVATPLSRLLPSMVGRMDEWMREAAPAMKGALKGRGARGACACMGPGFCAAVQVKLGNFFYGPFQRQGMLIASSLTRQAEQRHSALLLLGQLSTLPS